MSETPPWITNEVRALALALFSPTPTSVSAIEAAMLSVAARVERETREADAKVQNEMRDSILRLKSTMVKNGWIEA